MLHTLLARAFARSATRRAARSTLLLSARRFFGADDRKRPNNNPFSIETKKDLPLPAAAGLLFHGCWAVVILVQFLVEGPPVACPQR